MLTVLANNERLDSSDRSELTAGSIEDIFGRHEETVNCNDTSIQIISYGNFPPSRVRNDPPLELIIVGTGNPGVPAFYENFARLLYKRTKTPIWIPSLVGFANQDHLSCFASKMNLEGQVKTRKEMFLKYLKRVQVICIDHSTSCYITIHLLKCPECSPIIADAYFIMPVLNKPDNFLGGFLYFLLALRLSKLAEIFWKLHDNLPLVLSTPVFRTVCDKTLADFLNSNLHLDCYQKFIYVAQELLVKTPMKEIPYEFFRKNSHRMHFYLSKGDVLQASWCASLSQVLPDSDVRFSPKNERHAFFVNDWEHVAEFMADWVFETKERRSVS